LAYLLRVLTVAVLLLIVSWLLSQAVPALSSPIKPTTPHLDIRGGGWLGYRLGFAGSLLLVLAQIYSFKLHSILSSKVSPRAFLDMHCYLSIAGALLILVHSGFPVPALAVQPLEHIHPGKGLEGLVGVQWLAMWLVIILVASGVYGKYLYWRRPPTGPFKPFRYWLVFHIAVSGVLYVTGVTHLILVLVIKHITAI
jgi:hypothetical protein